MWNLEYETSSQNRTEPILSGFLFGRKGTFLPNKKHDYAHSRARNLLPDGKRARRGCAPRRTLFWFGLLQKFIEKIPTFLKGGSSIG
ncbi:MAG: hypothetical protein KH128_11440 [Firmicutes bacterium]|nr:hypothetical protein [Bacillota bacterium]